jgi:hypothetical protein
MQLGRAIVPGARLRIIFPMRAVPWLGAARVVRGGVIAFRQFNSSGVDSVSETERTRQLRRHDERLAELRGLL